MTLYNSELIKDEYLNNQSITCAEIAKKYGCSATTVSNILKRYGVTIRERKSKVKDLMKISQEVIDIYRKSNNSIELTAKHYNTYNNAILRVLHNNGIKTPYRKYKANDDFFDTLTEDSLWVLGWYFSDGCNSNNSLIINIHKRDIDVLEKIKILMSATNPIIAYNNDRHVRFIIMSKKLSETATKLGCVPNKSLIIKYPEYLTEEWQHKNFIKGVFEGDGGVSKYKNKLNFRVHLCSGSSIFIEKMVEIIKKYLDIKIRVAYDHVVNLNINLRDAVKFLNWIYDNGNTKNYLNRKFNLYKECVKLLNERDERKSSGRPWKRKIIWLISPDKVVYKVMGYGVFCKKYNLCASGIHNLSKGIIKEYRGWIAYDYKGLGEPKEYITEKQHYTIPKIIDGINSNIEEWK